MTNKISSGKHPVLVSKFEFAMGWTRDVTSIESVIEQPCKSVVEVNLTSPIMKNVYESVTCDGKIVSSKSVSLSIGQPAVITAVYVTEGEEINAGDKILDYTVIEKENTNYDIASIYYDDVKNSYESISSDINNEDILAAAEIYMETGEIPD